MADVTRRLALFVFAFLVIAGPLLFGAVDRAVQTLLVGVFVVGMLLEPPRFPAHSFAAKMLGAAFVALLLAAQFAPASWFPPPEWRTVLHGSFGIDFPWTRHPEPARAFDLLLVAVIAGLWLLWVRTLAADRRNRAPLAWILFAAGVIVAGVALLAPAHGQMIYGLRSTPGWTGFGPFPNRNHTADLLAMSALLGCGCLVRAGERKDAAAISGAALGVGLVFVALLQSNSRGGLVALGVGLLFFLGVVLYQTRGKKAAAIAGSCALVAAALALALGPGMLARFADEGGSGIPANVRWAVWRDTLDMFRDAPLLGHGLGAFPLVFPMYQELKLVDVYVIHPESSWLAWLSELGALPLLALLAFAAVLIVPAARATLRRSGGLYLRVGAVAAVAAIAVHCLFDVPGHRWGTAGFALAALALALPGAASPRRSLGKGAALIPLTIAAFWALPFLTDFRWSPTAVDLALGRNSGPDRAPIRALSQAAQVFPLDPNLQQALALRELAAGRPGSGWQHARLANRLMPGSWSYPAAQATASRLYSANMALYFWALAVERSGFRERSVFESALELTADLPIAESFWARFAETNPRFLLLYGGALPDDAAGRYYFQTWWQKRAAREDLRDYEIEAFHRHLARWAGPAELEQWMKMHAAWEPRDFRAWAALLHRWSLDARAWALLARHVPEPELPRLSDTSDRSTLETRLRTNPGDAMAAIALVALAEREGNDRRARALIETMSRRDDAPGWFKTRAAHLLAREGRHAEAVAMLLRGERSDF